MGLGNYTIKRILLLIPVFIGISAVVFLLLKLAPGDPVTALLPPQSRDPQTVANLRERLGLDEPIYIQYLKWLWSAMQGDLGRSYATRQPVLGMILNRLWPTIQISIVAFVVALFIAIPLGVLSAVYKDTWVDHFGRIVAFTGISMPSFWLGIMIILVFALFWKQWFGGPLIPAGGYVPPRAGIVPWLRHVLPPGIVLGVGFSAITTRLTRSAMVEVLNEDYVRTARAKGVREKGIILVHALRNAMIPVVTILGLQVGFLLNGAVVVEQVFQWPGVGRLLYQAVQTEDMPLIQGLVLFIAFVFVMMNLLVDLTYAVLDPRIKYD
jgi:peptide/nickel transport system permease protein